jgi:hypothetical protein
MAAFLMFAGSAFAAPPNLKQASINYKTGKYQEACNELKEIVRLQPTNMLAHYYLALSHQALGHMSDAKLQYQWVIAHGDAKFRSFAQTGLSQLGTANVSSSSQSLSPTATSPAPASGKPKVAKILEFYADW